MFFPSFVLQGGKKKIRQPVNLKKRKKDGDLYWVICPVLWCPSGGRGKGPDPGEDQVSCVGDAYGPVASLGIYCVGTDRLWVSPGTAYLSPVCIHGGYFFFAEVAERALAALWFCTVFLK